MLAKDKKGAIIELKNVKKIYMMGDTKVSALDGVSLSVRRGEFISIMGPSGSGKSTMMNMIGCLDTPTEGTIFLDSHNISKLKESDLAQIRGRKIGFVFQKANLIQTATAFENVTLPMIFQNISRTAREKKAKELLNIVGLEKRLNHYPSEMSGGEQQRVAIARALANDPEVILADEPTGNLDSKTGIDVMNFITKLHKERGKTIVMVTHDANMSRFAERVVYIKDGAILKETVNK